jgi:hypothetical protein
LLISVEEFGSTGAAEISVFHKLLAENGTNPPRLAFCPSVNCWHELLEFPVPPEPPDPDPPDPDPPEPDPPELFPPLPPPRFTDVPLVQPTRKTVHASRHAQIDDFQGECGWIHMLLFFRMNAKEERERGLRSGRNPDTDRRNVLTCAVAAVSVCVAADLTPAV